MTHKERHQHWDTWLKIRSIADWIESISLHFVVLMRLCALTVRQYVLLVLVRISFPFIVPHQFRHHISNYVVWVSSFFYSVCHCYHPLSLCRRRRHCRLHHRRLRYFCCRRSLHFIALPSLGDIILKINRNLVGAIVSLNAAHISVIYDLCIIRVRFSHFAHKSQNPKKMCKMFAYEFVCECSSRNANEN